MGIWGEEIEKWYHLVLSGKFVANTLPPLVSTWDLKTSKIGSFKNYVAEHIVRLLRWLPPVLHFLEPLNFTKGFLAHHDGLLPVLARWCYNSF